MKKSLTKLSRTIFWNDVVPKISSERKVKFPKTYFESLINNYLTLDITLMSKRFTCNPPETYANSSNLHSQIASAFGAGIHFLIPVNRDVYENNKIISIGKAKKFILLDDFKRLNMGIKDIDVRGVWKELGYFIEDEYRMESLSKWF